MKPGIYVTIIGLFSVMLSIIGYLNDPSLYYLPIILFLLIVPITGLFDLIDNYNKNFYSVVVAVILVVMWILSFIQPLSDVNRIIYYIETGVITLIIIAIHRPILKARNNIRKELEPYDKILAINSNDITALNNKGVKLAGQLRYKESMQCFDKILEMDPKEVTALHNKDFVEEIRDHTVADYFKKIPNFKIIEKKGKLILETKKKETS